MGHRISDVDTKCHKIWQKSMKHRNRHVIWLRTMAAMKLMIVTQCRDRRSEWIGFLELRYWTWLQTIQSDMKHTMVCVLTHNPSDGP